MKDLEPIYYMEQSVKNHLSSGAMDSPDKQTDSIHKFMKEFKLTARQAVSLWTSIVCKVGANINTTH